MYMEDLLAMGNVLKILGLMGMEVDTKQESIGDKMHTLISVHLDDLDLDDEESDPDWGPGDSD